MTALHTHRSLVKKVLILAVVYACCIVTITWLAWKAGSMKGMRFIELEPLWHPREIMDHLSMEDEQEKYMYIMLFVDYINIGIYTMLFRSVIMLFYKNAGWLLLLPVIMAVCDIVENFLMSQLLLEASMSTATGLNIIILIKLLAGMSVLIVIAKGVLGNLARSKI